MTPHICPSVKQLRAAGAAQDEAEPPRLSVIAVIITFACRGRCSFFVTCPPLLLLPAERDIKIVRPLYSVEVTETETAKFETEISEDDVHGNWKLKDEALHQSAVSGSKAAECARQLHLAQL